MDAKRIQLNEGVLEACDVSLVVDALAEGQLVILPTETVYGLVGDERCRQVFQRIADLKGRPVDQPFARLVGSVAQVERHGGVFSEDAKCLAEKFWPGPLTMVCPHPVEGHVGYRMPDHAVPLAVLEAVGAPLLGTSVNRHGAPEALTGGEAYEVFGQEVAVVVDAGLAQRGQASTVVRMGESLEILREGEVSLNALKNVLSI